MAANENVFHEAFLQVGINTRKPIRVGVEQSTIVHHGRPYLSRWIAYLSGTLRLHRFLRGDDDRAPHDHPWWFVTFPFTPYVEKFWTKYYIRLYDMKTDQPLDPPEFLEAWYENTRVVKAWRFHFRPAAFRHFVIGRADGKDKPFWTLVITGFAANKWGFWPKPDQFVPHKEWK